ncbi:hypothetical protein D9757_012890 [Collybiopsis confluens]|uniref:BTB domain-containing protein n=1 Tax=Collybiopsis confluens TaxID=2823264 RepID=A0A8H5G8M4_9AGAR|nr:hypothetical protein D9757_012890 [Collybiopsis confluens]
MDLSEADSTVSTEIRTSGLFQAQDADVVIRSSDNFDFHLHKKYLEFATGGFPSADTPTNEEVVKLPETASTLEYLFQFVYPQRHPSLDRLGFAQLIELAEAAEKYEVYGALTACHLTLR